MLCMAKFDCGCSRHLGVMAMRMHMLEVDHMKVLRLSGTAVSANAIGKQTATGEGPEWFDLGTRLE